MPSALSIPMNMPKYNWFYHTEPEPHLDGRRMHTPRGKVLGGSSSINGLVYIRGNPQDFERWAAEGAQGWAYRDVLPYFKRAERRAGRRGSVPRRFRQAHDPLRNAEQPAACRVARRRRASGLSAQPGRQRLSAGGLRPHGHDGGRGSALQRRARLPAPRARPAEFDGASRMRSPPACCSRAAAPAD